MQDMLNHKTVPCDQQLDCRTKKKPLRAYYCEHWNSRIRLRWLYSHHLIHHIHLSHNLAATPVDKYQRWHFTGPLLGQANFTHWMLGSDNYLSSCNYVEFPPSPVKEKKPKPNTFPVYPLIWWLPTPGHEVGKNPPRNRAFFLDLAGSS